ncbi:MAG: MFS transporter [Firmicutes bacterium]|nr:MFS transporter [Bacillota bacterium]
MSKKAKILLVISGLFALGLGMSNVFVNVFLWKKSSSIITVATYNLMHYIFIPLSFIVGGWISKRKNGIWPLRVGIIGYVVFFITILVFRNDIENLIFPLGCLFGISSGFYWLSFSVLSFDFTSINNRDTFNGINGCVMGISNAIAPFIASLIIANFKNISGYIIVFSISLVLFLILILVSLLLHSNHYGEYLDIKKIIRSGNNQWKKMRISTVAWGFRDVVILFLISILLYKTTKSEVALGEIYLISYLISSAAYLLQQKIIKPKRRMFSMHLGSIIMFIAVVGLAIRISYSFILIYVILDAIFMPFFSVPRLSAIYNLLSKNHDENMRTEYIINNELALNLGRIISTSILILLIKTIPYDNVLNLYLLSIGSSQFIALFFLKKLDVWVN